MDMKLSKERDSGEGDLDEINNKISELDKWREIFSRRGLQFKDTTLKKSQDSRRADSDGEDGAGHTLAKPRGHAPAFCAPYSIPKALLAPTGRGGSPITQHTALELRRVLFGTTFQVFNYEWKKSHFKFREAFSDLSYALEAERSGSRAVQMAIQAHVIKHLLFTPSPELASPSIKRLHGVGQKQQEGALGSALTDILWMAGEGEKAVISLVTTDSHLPPSVDYKMDGYTERLQLFHFTEKAELQNFISEHINCFKDEGSHGVILFLYSLIFSRTLTRLHEDLDRSTSHLLQLSLGNFICRQALINLLLTGRASPNVFNGDLDYNAGSGGMEGPLRGVLARSDVGFLSWSREQHLQVGSMLKTPKLPIWLCNINGTYSIFFSTNRLLLSDWKMEHLFDLFFYSGQPSQSKTVTLTIDTHSHHWEEGLREDESDPEKRFPSVEMTVRTKWEGAAIDWHGTIPFF
eukprot:gi/632968683/ref/XP_007900659.1/ PREDICTED: protein FAM188B2-like [Callorhinchus milii]